jgi:hypothetical protein
MLLNEFLKEHRQMPQLEGKAQEQDAKTQRQEALIVQQQKQIEALTAVVQKVSEEIEVNKTTPQLVADHR